MAVSVSLLSSSAAVTPKLYILNTNPDQAPTTSKVEPDAVCACVCTLFNQNLIEFLLQNYVVPL